MLVLADDVSKLQWPRRRLPAAIKDLFNRYSHCPEKGYGDPFGCYLKMVLRLDHAVVHRL